MKKQILYWVFQIVGWLFFVFVGGIQTKLNGQEVDVALIISLGVIFVIGITLTQLLRLVIIKTDLFNRPFIRQIALLLLTILVLSVVFNGSYGLYEWVFSQKKITFQIGTELIKILNWALLFFLWTLLYYAYLLIQKFRKQEITNLKLSAAKAEVELNLLRSQLNPHFIFNSMNTIRALVDENPDKAKSNVLKLSNILRSTLLTSKNNLITLDDELKLVENYLDLEQTRFEERLQVIYKIDKNCLPIKMPPMLLQTLVENGIKHGVSKIAKGGKF